VKRLVRARTRCFVVLTDAAGIPLPGENYRIKRRPEDDALVLARRMLRSKMLSEPRWPFRGPNQGIA
jgi:hypothetical protein